MINLIKLRQIRQISFKNTLFLSKKHAKTAQFISPLRFFATKQINVPFMGDSITEGTLITILKEPGDSVVVDEVVAEIETDKTSLEIRSSESGLIKKCFFSQDDAVKVDEPLFEVDTDAKVSIETKKTSKKEDNSIKDEKIANSVEKQPENVEIKKKIEKKVQKSTPPKKSNETESAKNETKNFTHRGERKVPLSRMRLRIAERLKESQNTAASLTTFHSIDCSKILEMKSHYKDQFLESTGVKLGLMSPFVKASTLALQRFPELNAYFDAQAKCITLHDFVDISVAVAGPNGLVVPVIRNTETLNFAQIEKAIKNYAIQAKEGKLKIEDMTGGTFTISNSGIYKSDIGTPIINPPQSAVLGLYGIHDTPVAVDKKVVVRPIMKVALTYDHRMVDGREAILFLRAVKDYIEDPLTMLFR